MAAPDAEGPFTFAHRRAGATDIYFVEGTGAGEMTFRAAAPSVEVWDAVTGLRAAAQARRTADGRTTVALDLPTDGSAFVVFREVGSVAQERDPPAGTTGVPPVARRRHSRRAVAASCAPPAFHFSFFFLHFSFSFARAHSASDRAPIPRNSTARIRSSPRVSGSSTS